MPAIPESASGESFSGEITVASRIVDQLSSGLYDSPAACLKELVNNSYDADASKVEIFVRPDADRIIIEDDGLGLSRVEFERHFSRISESRKREEGELTPSGRPKIGKIGIGFIAANEICDVMEISSTKAGSRDLMQVSLNFHEMRRDPAERRRESGDVAEGDYSGVVTPTASPESHFTRVFLKDIRGSAKEILAGATRMGSTGVADSVYGLKPESITRRLLNVATWDDLDLYSQTLLRVALNVPVRYLPEWAPEKYEPELRPFEREVSQLGFQVWYDGTELRKPVVLSPNSGKTLVHTFQHDGTHVGCRGYFYARHGVLRPNQLNGVLIRIRHAAVGEYDPSYLGFPSSTGTLFQRWITGEIWADDRLEEAMNIDRRTLRITEPSYVELQTIVHQELAVVLGRVKREIYESQSQVRRSTQARREVREIDRIVERSQLPPATARAVVSEWKTALARDAAPRSILRKFTVSELFDLTLEVAEETLDRASFRRFVKALTERLTR